MEPLKYFALIAIQPKPGNKITFALTR